MSTIATPREPPRRIPSAMANANPHSVTPTSSSRPSLDTARSATSSPSIGGGATFGVTSGGGGTPGTPSGTGSGGSGSVRRNRAALRDFYNLKKQPAGTPPSITLDPSANDDAMSVASSTGPGGAGYGLDANGGLGVGTNRLGSFSEVRVSELDGDKFDADDYVKRTLAESSLEELLRTYTRVLGEIRALDAEKKALVYDNYSKLIAATETIRKMRSNMDPQNPMSTTLDPAIAQIYTQASAIRDVMRRSISEPLALQSLPPTPKTALEKGTTSSSPLSDASLKNPQEVTSTCNEERPPSSSVTLSESQLADRRRLRRIAREVLDTPARLRDLVRDGRHEEAKLEWILPRKLLESWRVKGQGGAEVVFCLMDGDAALRGDHGAFDWRTSPEHGL